MSTPTEHEHHIVGPKIYLLILCALLVLTATTTGAAFINMGVFSPIVALGIAWIVGAVALDSSSSVPLRSEIRGSAILRALDKVLPPSGPVLDALARIDPLPSVHGPAATVTGPAWGGSLEIVDFHLRTGRYLRPEDSYDGAVLFLETSEELPAADYVYRVLMCMGERKLLQRFAAIVWARPRAWSIDDPREPSAKAAYTREQHEAVLAAVNEYHPGVPLVFGVDFGHTEPQHIIPSGGTVTVDGVAREIYVTY